jgi:TonB family protein
MAAPSLAPTLDSASRRRVLRYPIGVPLDLIALQSGIPNTMPGRCTDLSEGGLGVIVAGELLPGQPVAVELRLPNVGLPIRARAQVRYHDRLRYGLQFAGLSMEQREMIRYWTAQLPPEPEQPRQEKEEAIAPAPRLATLETAPAKQRRVRRIRVRRRRFFVLLVFMLALAGFGWWEWQKAWNRLEESSALGKDEPAAAPLRVPSEVMDRQILYKVDPVYPEAARATGTEGLVVLDALIAADGSVKRVRPITGRDVLTQSALTAVQAWKYTPYRKDGQAVEVETTVTLDFRLR